MLRRSCPPSYDTLGKMLRGFIILFHVIPRSQCRNLSEHCFDKVPRWLRNCFCALKSYPSRPILEFNQIDASIRRYKDKNKNTRGARSINMSLSESGLNLARFTATETNNSTGHDGRTSISWEIDHGTIKNH